MSQDLDMVARWTWYVLTALFFGLVRSIIRQEYKTPTALLAVTIVAFGCAMFTAFVMSELGYPNWAVYSGVAVASLVSNDLMKILLNFCEMAAKDKGYLGKIATAIVKVSIPKPEIEGLKTEEKPVEKQGD